MIVEKMKVQGLDNPVGIGTKNPVLSYYLKVKRNQGKKQWQNAFRVLAASDIDLLKNDIGDLWDSGICRQRENFGIVYAGKRLHSRQRVYWKVMIWDQDDTESEWSDISFWEMGLLCCDDWKGHWIGQGDDYHENKSNAPMFIKNIVYKMIMNKTAPSYAFFVKSGFTTLPEYWNCDELWCGMERSRNHAMMGHVKEWMSRYMLGIKPLEPAYKRVQIKPYLPDNVDKLEGSVFCPFGKIWVQCKRDENCKILIKIELPPGVEVFESSRFCRQ